MNNYLYGILVMLISAAPMAQAAGLSGRPGAFADIGLGLRPLGMAGSYSALASDENAARWNPAMLAEVEDWSAGFSWAKQFNLISYNYIALAAPQAVGNAGLGAYVIASGDEVYNETTIGLAAGMPLEGFGLPIPGNAGAGLKYLNSSFGSNSDGGADRVQGSANGFGLDLAWHWRPLEEASFAVVIHDLVNVLSWDRRIEGSTPSSKTYSEGVPTTMVLGLAWQLEAATFSSEYRPGLYGDVADRFIIGGEFSFWSVVKARFGLGQNMSGSDRNRWVTLGLGIEIEPSYLGPVQSVRFGYTHLVHDIAATPRVGLTLSW
ncbi:MAG: hypothetical protein FJY67_05505 [Calditrichaeota bacterium]|nr:hypothetical protein [Calditrichota bacterium]